MKEDWKIKLENYIKQKYGETTSNGPFEINLGEIDFLIPPTMAIDSKNFWILKKYNAKKSIFGGN